MWNFARISRRWLPTPLLLSSVSLPILRDIKFSKAAVFENFETIDSLNGREKEREMTRLKSRLLLARIDQPECIINCVLIIRSLLDRRSRNTVNIAYKVGKYRLDRTS